MSRMHGRSDALAHVGSLGSNDAACAHAWSLDLRQPRMNVLYVSCDRCGASRAIQRQGAA
jgi:hypothetical protein